MIKKWRDYYENLSYQNKLNTLFYTLFLVVAILLITIGAFFINMLSQEIYDHNREKLAILTMNVETELNNIETIPTEIHRNNTLQISLKKSMEDDLTMADSINIQRSVSDELSWVMADKPNITSLVMLNGEGKRLSGTVSDEEDFFDGKSLNTVAGLVGATSNNGRWLFDKELKEAVFVQNIFSTRSYNKNRIGTVVVTVNTSFIQNFLQESEIFSDKDLFALEYNGNLSSTNWVEHNDYLDFLKSNSSRLRNQRNYELATINQNKFFILSTRAEVGNSDIQFYYFILNRQLVERLVQAELIFALIILFVFGLSVYLGKRYLRHLIEPINVLAHRMKRFNGESDLNQLKEISDSMPSATRPDEIGVLYSSFNELIHEIEDLVIKDYQSKLLNQEMEYKFLQAQLDPHFLYNTLNTINWMALSKGDTEISEMVTSLAFLFRKKVDKTSDFWSVAEELEIIQAYLNIQTIRFKSRLIFESSVGQDVMGYQIPKLIIQPLIENAVKYAVEKFDQPVHICLEILIQRGYLQVLVQDDGPGFDNSKKYRKQSTGLGLENIRSRIRLIYGEEGALRIDSIPGKTEVAILLPERFFVK